MTTIAALKAAIDARIVAGLEGHLTPLKLNTTLQEMVDVLNGLIEGLGDVIVVADLTAAAALTGLDKGDIVHVSNNGAGKWVRYQVTVAGDGTWAGATKIVYWTQDQAPASHGHVVGDLTNASANARSLLQAADYAAMRALLSLGTAALLTAGTSANNAVQLDGSARLPAVDGSQLTNLPSAPVTSVFGRTGAVAKTAGDYLLSDLFACSFAPQGRLTLTTGTPVMTGNVFGAATVFYTPYTGRHMPIWDGARWRMREVTTELSNVLSDTTKNPAAAIADRNYDLYVWNDGGTFRLSRSPAWATDTTRGTGAGSAEQARTAGILTNAVAITNGPGANLGTYVGTIRTNGSGLVDWILGGTGAGGVAAVLGVWNAYNRVRVSGVSRSSTDSWAYAVTTIRAAESSNAMRVSMIRGADEDTISARYTCSGQGQAGVISVIGIGLDSTTAFSGARSSAGANGSQIATGTGYYSGLPGLGWHYVQALEGLTGNVSVTFYGDNATALYQNGLTVDLLA